MKKTNLGLAMSVGVIAITSTMMLACTMNETSTTAGQPVGAEPAPEESGGSEPAAAWKAKLARTAGSTGTTSPAGVTPRLRAGAGGTCGLSTGDVTCDTCLDTSCCTENTACVSNADCTALITCGNACNDDACFSACFDAHPTGAALLGTLSSCVETGCAVACGGPPPPPGPGPGPRPGSCGLTSGDLTCDACLDGSCCAQTTACLGDPDCIATLDCYQTCSDATCAAACDAAHPSGSAKLDATFTCVQTSCTAACQL